MNGQILHWLLSEKTPARPPKKMSHNLFLGFSHKIR
jgi:hypothetical protein